MQADTAGMQADIGDSRHQRTQADTGDTIDTGDAGRHRWDAGRQDLEAESRLAGPGRNCTPEK